MKKILIIILFAFLINIYAEDKIILTKSTFKPKIALVLSGGGARGIAHLGVIKELETNGIKPDYIVGTSVGAVVGGLYASGYSTEELEYILKSTDWNEIFSFNQSSERENLFLDQKEIEDRSVINLRFNNFKFIVPESVSEGSKFLKFLQKHYWNAIYKPENSFYNLKIPFVAVATDLVKGKSIRLDSGNIINSVKASTTIPLQFSPVRMDSMVLVDGGLFANIPVDFAKDFNPDLIIAVNTTSPLLNMEELNTPWNIADQAISLSMMEFSKKSLEKADIIINPNIPGFLNTDFNHLDSLILGGQTATKETIVRIQEKIRSYSNNSRSIIKGLNSDNIIINSFDKEDSVAIMQSNKIISVIHNLLLINKYSSIEIKNIDNILYIKGNKNNIIKKIELIGSTNLKTDSLMSYLNIKYKGKYYHNEIKNELSENIIRYFRSYGFSFATLDSIIAINGTLKCYFDERRIDEIIVESNNDINKFLILRNITFDVGDPIRARKIIKSWNKLYNTGLFKDIDIIPEINKDSSGGRVIIKVTEAPNQIIRLGARIDNENNTQAGIDFTQENLFNYGHRLTTRFELSNRFQRYFFIFENPRILSSKISSLIKIYYKRQFINQYINNPNSNRNEFKKLLTGENILENYGGVVSVGQQFETFGKLQLSYKYEYQRYFESNIEPSGFNLISTIKPELIFDSENDYYFANQGRKIQISLETSLFNFDENISFSKVFFKYRTNFSFNSNTITPSILFGAADQTLPETEFFNLGGQENFFGLRDFAERGRQIIKASLKYRYKFPFDIFFDTYISGRYDIGSTWEMPDVIKLSSLKHGLGLSLALDTPIGPSKVSIGRSFFFLENPNGIAWGDLLLYFSIGLKM